jgi:queuosine precursor transporter
VNVTRFGAGIGRASYQSARALTAGSVPGYSTILDRKQQFFLWLTAIFVAALITGDFIGGRFFVLFGHTFSAGIIPFPLTFVLTDVVNEFYGTSGARRLTFLGLGAAVFVWGVIQLALHLPPSPTSPISDAVFHAAFGTAARLYIASLSAYVVGQLLDISIFRALRRMTGHHLLWLRATGSTVVSQMIDSFTVSFVFLAGTQTLGFITTNAANNYVGKLIMAVLLTPVIYAMHAVFRRRFNVPEPVTPEG